MGDTTTWKAGFKKGSAWGTAVACGANDGVLLSQESMPEAIPEPIKDEVVGMAMASPAMQGNFKADGGGFVEPVRYEGFERRLALFAGADTCTQIGVTGVYKHVMPVKASNAGKFATLVLDKNVGTDQLWEYPSAKLAGLELSHENGRLVANWEAIANKCERASAVNTSATFANVTYPTTGLMVIFNQLTLLMKEITGAEGNLGPAPTDEFKVSSAKLSIKRNQSGDFVCGTNAGQIDEPGVNGLPEAQLIVTFPQHNAAVDALIKAAQIRQTASVPKKYKASLKWLGPIAAGSTNYYLEVLLGCMTINKAPANAGGPGSKVPVEMTFDVWAPDAAGNGTDWAWVTVGGDPIQITLANKNTASAA